MTEEAGGSAICGRPYCRPLCHELVNEDCRLSDEPCIPVPKAVKPRLSSPLRSPGSVLNDRRYSEYSAS
ncbi:hypothetical protein [Streptomyces niveus]|uniref:hypothetical protein n=1 Tax=Streptomyces niveus TaxID=193462 RepID=UPI003645891D